MRITLLGTGTSTGVPQIGCTCPVCTSTDPHDKRLRCSALIESGSTRILVDCGPDFRQQMLNMDFRSIDAVLLTHMHYDHVGGLDDLRPYSIFGNVHIYADHTTAKAQRERIPYCFAEHKYPGVPKILLHEVEPHQVFQVGELAVTPIQVMHGKLPILGYRIGDVAYLTDLTTLPDSELPLLEGIKVLIEGALRYEPHHTHQTVEDAIHLSKLLGNPETYLIHMCHHVGLHAEVEKRLPAHIHLGFDGLTMKC